MVHCTAERYTTELLTIGQEEESAYDVKVLESVLHMAELLTAGAEEASPGSGCSPLAP